jgi:hypothetical protein
MALVLALVAHPGALHALKIALQDIEREALLKEREEMIHQLRAFEQRHRLPVSVPPKRQGER